MASVFNTDDAHDMKILTRRVNDDEDWEPCTPSSNSDSDSNDDARPTTNSSQSLLKTASNGPKWVKKSNPTESSKPKTTSDHSPSQWRRNTPKKAPTIDFDVHDYTPPRRTYRLFPNDLVYGVIFSRPFRTEIIRIINTHFQNTFININQIYDKIQPMLEPERFASYYNQPELVKFSLYRLLLNWVDKRVLTQSKRTKQFKMGAKFLREYHKTQTYLDTTKTTPGDTTTTPGGDTPGQNEDDTTHTNDTQHNPKDEPHDMKEDLEDDEKFVEQQLMNDIIANIDTYSILFDEYKQPEGIPTNTVPVSNTDLYIATEPQTYFKSIAESYEIKYATLKNLADAMDGSCKLDVEMEMGSIVASISSNIKSVLTAFTKFEMQMQIRSTLERQYAWRFLTQLIVKDQRIITAQSTKFAMAQFITLIMSEYGTEYVEIYKSVMYHYSLWTVCYVEDEMAKDYMDGPSIKRCQVLKYRGARDPDEIPFDEMINWQVFSDSDVFEEECKYYQRNESICRVYASVLCYRENKIECWRWCASLLMLPESVYPEVLCIVCGVFEVIGSMMLKEYPRQFSKAIAFVQENIYKKCDDSTPERAKAKRKWSVFWDIITKQYDEKKAKFVFEIVKPEESVLISETVGATVFAQAFN
eukprot:143198_1